MYDVKSAKRDKKHAVIYFNPGSTNIMKELAKKIRAEGGRTTLVWSNKWQGAQNILPEAKAVVIEIDCANAEEIQDAYLALASDVEVHFVDHDGEFIGEDTATEPEAEDDQVVRESDATIPDAAEDDASEEAQADTYGEGASESENAVGSNDEDASESSDAGSVAGNGLED